MSWLQIFPVGDADATEFERFIIKNSGSVPTVTQIEQASDSFRVGYALFENSDKAEKVRNELNKSQFKGKKIHAVQIEPVEDEYGILVGPKGFVQEGNYESERGSRYYPGHQSSLVSGSSKRHTNRRSYQQQQTDPRNFGSIANKYDDDEDQPAVQPNMPYQQNSRYPPSTFNRPQQFPEQGYDQRNMSFGNEQNEKISSKDSKSKSRHRKHRRDSSDSSSSSSSSDSSYSSPKQSRHKHRHHRHHHRKSK